MNFLDENINKIINADCLDIFKQLPDKCIDLVLTDPPYGIGNKFTSEYGLQERKSKRGSFSWNDKIPEKEVFDEIIRVSKNQIIFGGNYFTEYLKPTKSWLVWDKIGQYDLKNPFSDCELAWTSFSCTTKNTLLSTWVLLPEKKKKVKEFTQHKSRFNCSRLFCRIFQNQATLCLIHFLGPELLPLRHTSSDANSSASKKPRITGLRRLNVWRKPISSFLFLII